jgi:hypothetical protein
MIFSAAAAVVLYVASSIYQARQNANRLKEYAQQRWLIGWQVSHAMRSAYQNSLDNGFGLADLAVTSLGNTNYSMTTANGAAGTIPDFLNNLPANSLWQKTAAIAPSLTQWYETGSGVFKFSGVNASDFNLSDIFRIPGYSVRQTLSGNLAATTVQPSIGSESTHNFQSFKNSGRFITGSPADVRGRPDLPFGGAILDIQGPNTYTSAPLGMFRWVREDINYTITPNDPVVSGITGNVTTPQSIWALEEPITNYQLLLLNPTTSSWQVGVGSGTVRVENSGANGVNRARMFIWGNAKGGAGSLGLDSLANGSNYLPTAALVGGSLDDTTAEGRFEWRIARASTRVSFGRPTSAPGDWPLNQAGTAGLGALSNFLASPAFYSYKDSTGAVGPRRVDIFNTQAARTPVFSGVDISNSAGWNDNTQKYWANPTFFMNSAGYFAWTFQNSNTAAGSQVLYSVLTSPPWTDNGNNVGSLGVIRYGQPANNIYGSTLGVSGNVQSGAISSTAVITIDLKIFGNDLATNFSGNPGNGYSPWSIPQEIFIYPDSSLAARSLVVRILGNGGPTAAGLPPVRIVVAGRTGANMSQTEVRLIPDVAATATTANSRRFVLLFQNFGNGSPTLSVENAIGANWQDVGTIPWYGVLIAPYGLNIGSYNADQTFTNGVPARGTANNRIVNWYGTMLVGQSMTLDTPINLCLLPDNGSTQPLWSVFVPAYNNANQNAGATPQGRPVPILVPRMVWNFE